MRTMLMTGLTNIHRARLQGSVLSYALFVSLIITIIISSIILYAYFNHIYRSNYRIQQRLFSNAESGLAVLMTDSLIAKYDEPKKISLFGGNQDSVLLIKELWGLYDKLYCSAKYKRFRKEVIVLADSYYKDEYIPTLYLANHNKPLCVCGQTLIKGNCLLPIAGVKSGYVEGRHFERKKLIEGKSGFSGNKLPENRRKFELNDFKRIKEKYLDSGSTILLHYNELQKDTLSNSFLDSTILIYDQESLDLKNFSSSGNIIIMTEKDLIIRNSCNFNNILCYAKNIFIEDNFRGQLQCIASDTLICGQNCLFSYPSNLVVSNRDSTILKKGFLKIGRNTKIEGAVVLNTHWKHQQYKPEIHISPLCEIKGQLYCNGAIQLEGNVFGTVFTNMFILRKPSALYNNHLLDIELNIEKLDHYFVGPNFTNNSRPLKIAKKLF